MDSKSPTQFEATKPTILVIEDNSDDYFMIRWGLLQQFPTMEPIRVHDATQIIPHLDSCLKEGRDLPLFILLDLYFPSAEVGLSVLKSLKSHQVYQQIPTIILSRSADPQDMRDVFNYSGNLYIIKPVKPKEWLETFTMLQNYLK